MNTIDWGSVKFRASSWGALMAEPKSAEDKKAGRLGETCKGELVKIYNLAKYGRKKGWREAELIASSNDKHEEAPIKPEPERKISSPSIIHYA